MGKKQSAGVPASGPLAQIFGVRHLSPAGAWHLQRFIEQIDPTAILIEGPSDATDLLKPLVHEKTRPPVAVLAFTKQRPVRSILYPLAAYSPEWIALTTGLRKKRLVRFIDLPAAVFLALHNVETIKPDATELAPTTGDTQAYLDDPYEQIAWLAGDPDHDTWWERNFEHLTADAAYREAICEFGRGLRELPSQSARRDQETLIREAYMRRAIREVIDAGHDPQRIVVVCGAFHMPVLLSELPPMTDAELKELPKAETSLTLMPYSYYRLSAQSGYGAGNHAPRYFQLLWEELSADTLLRLPTRYTTEMAMALRRNGLVRSSAEVIEAVRLAHTLAALGGASAPTLRDLRDAATTCLAGGDSNVLARLLSDIEIGDEIGRLPERVSRTSIQDDFYHLVAALRLEEYLKDKTQIVKGHTGKPWLDRRLNRFVKTEDAAVRDRRRSIFFHRLQLLGIGFVKDVTSKEDRAESTYKEVWEARWTPECEISLVENALIGDTVETAAVLVLREKLEAETAVGTAATLAHQAVDCDLKDAMQAALERVQALAIDDTSFISIANAVYELAALVRYKDVTEIDVEPLKPLVAQLFLRAALLAHSATKCDDEAARATSQAMEQIHFVAFLEGWEDTDQQTPLLAIDRWIAALNAIADDNICNPYLCGLAAALLLERGLMNDEALERRVAQRISPGMDVAAGAGYFEGLASRNHMALLSRKQLWLAMSDFIESLDDGAFLRAVAGLRRAFASFTIGETRRLATVLAEIWQGDATVLTQAVETKLDAQELEKLAEELGDLGDLGL
ncbi:MAG: DUF5682 family protein [Acidobacteriota bacterium]